MPSTASLIVRAAVLPIAHSAAALADSYEGSQFHSGFFFIENIFYSDVRRPENIDYSQAIKHEVAAAAQCPTLKMEETLFSDLRIRLGAQYLYQHQGNCEHILVVNDVRYESSTLEECRLLLTAAQVAAQ